MMCRKWILLFIILLLFSGLGMKKTSDEELNQWRHQYPSAGVSWNLIGDPVSCQRFAGEAKIMLYQLKNRMNIAVPKLTSFEDKYSPEPGTTIIVKSIFGQDFIEISTGMEGMGGKVSCVITLIDVPLYVPPMRNPGEIKTGEVQGVDYFKTYYSIDLSKCPTCQVTSWEFLFKYLQSSPLIPPTVPISTRKEWPTEPLHHQTFDADGKLIDEDVTDHTIYSLSPPAWGEVISFDADSGGTYIVWKAYTESGPYSRTGLGIMRLVARVKDKTGIEVCAQNKRIEVDCCLKDVKHRAVEIWWEGIGVCEPFIIYGGLHLCKAPTSLGMSGLNWYACMYPYQPFYSIPDIRGICLPVEWTLSGPIDFRGSDKNDNTIYIKCLESGCNEATTITLRDRCGGEYQIRARPCCEDADELSISYTSLVMGCSQQQDLTALGGCGPYTWTITSGGGTIGETGKTVTYYSPATNPNCANNPTIMVADCCGGSAELKLAVNCYIPGSTLALTKSDLTKLCCYKIADIDCSGGVVYNSKLSEVIYAWDCNGDLICTRDYSYNNIPSGSCTPPVNCTNYCPCNLVDEPGCWNNYQCVQGLTGCGIGDQQPCDTMIDRRTADMKTNGCCPINPLTGLPY